MWEVVDDLYPILFGTVSSILDGCLECVWSVAAGSGVLLQTVVQAVLWAARL